MRLPVVFASALAALAIAPAAASAGTITYQGDTLVLTAAPGEANSVTFGGEELGRLSISDSAAHSFPADRCTQVDVGYAIQCDLPSAVRADLGDGNDSAVVDHMVQGNPIVELLGGAGNDNLKAIEGNTRLTMDGGADADVLRSEGGNDVLRGGPDADELIGGAGSDVLVRRIASRRRSRAAAATMTCAPAWVARRSTAAPAKTGSRAASTTTS